MGVPAIRIRVLNGQPLRPERRWVVYWMTSFRRLRFNFALDRAVELARSLGRPLVILEALRVGYPFASDRLHSFVLQGMGDHARACAGAPVTYLPYVEPAPGAGRGLLAALAREACVVVGDDWPGFFVPRMQAAAAGQLDVRCERVDSCGLWPLHATDRVFTTAHSFRLHLQKELAPHLFEGPQPDPLTGLAGPAVDLPAALLTRWPMADAALLAAKPAAVRALPLDHQVAAVAWRGGAGAAGARLTWFLDQALLHYIEQRNEPEQDGTSRLSPYLHFGHLSVHQVLAELARREDWSPVLLGRSVGGAKAGWWRVSPAAEAFLDQLVTWRELCFNVAARRPDDHGSLATLPAYAQATLARHAGDPRPYLYSPEQLERSETHDPLWNAAQRQLVRDGWMHNYLRMLWGKKILEWSPTPADALNRMEGLMNRYALDGRDPCSYGGYLWILGRWDRAWGPERPIFGTVRYMSSANTAKKISVKRYLQDYGPEAP